MEWYGKKFRFINFVHYFKFLQKRGSQLRGSNVLIKYRKKCTLYDRKRFNFLGLYEFYLKFLLYTQKRLNQRKYTLFKKLLIRALKICSPLYRQDEVFDQFKKSIFKYIWAFIKFRLVKKVKVPIWGNERRSSPFL